MIYSALATASTMLIGLIRSNSWTVALCLLAVGVALLVYGIGKKKLVWKILGAVCAALAAASLLESFGILAGLPVLQVGVPAVLSLYFDIFSGGVQALVFSLLTMVYVGNACPPPEAKAAEA